MTLGEGSGDLTFITCPMGGEFDNQLGQIPILAPPWPHGVGVGHTIDRHIKVRYLSEE